MKKLITFLAVSITAIAVAAADPIIVGHGFVNFNALGTSFENLSPVDVTSLTPIDEVDSFGAFGSNISAGGGVGVNIPFAGYFGVQPEVDLYVNRVGYKYDSVLYGSDAVASFNYLSLDIPVLFTAKVEKWNFKVGPYVSIPLGNLKITHSNSSTNYSDDRKITSNAIFGMLAGIGYEERLGMGRIVFGVNYMLDFTPPVTIRNGSSDDYRLFTRRGLMIDIGYKVPLSF